MVGRTIVGLGKAVGATTVAAHLDGLADPAVDPTIELFGVRAQMGGLLPDTTLSVCYVKSLSDDITAGVSPNA